MSSEGIGLEEEHNMLADSVRRWAERARPQQQARDLLEAHPESLPECWSELAAQGWLGVHLPTRFNGGGESLVEAAVVLEALGHVATPGPVLPTMLAGALLAAADAPDAQQALLPGVADGTLVGAVALDSDDLAYREDGREILLSGHAGLVLGGGLAHFVIVGAGERGARRWFAVDVNAATVEPAMSLDGAQRLARVSFDGVPVPAERVLHGVDDQLVRDLAVTLASAEATGVAAWCLQEATHYAKVREQFGRPIGQFQAVKHLCASMLVAVERARATAWDAARAGDDPDERSVAAAVVGGVALDAAVDCAKDCIQVHGGIGYTWDHDAHLYLRRATVVRQVFGPADGWRVRAAELAVGGSKRSLVVDLPPEAEEIRAEVRAFADETADLKISEQQRRLAESGYMRPHWPRPYGRDAGPVEQVVIAQEFERAGVEPPRFLGGFGDWVVPTLIEYGSEEQKERFIPPTMRCELTWCQLFSEPGAGSDLASLQTKADRVEGGWVLNGQKVWTSFADTSMWAICLARTDPSAPKHDGITYFLVDMSSDGIDVRPLRELTGHAMFNEVFLNDVFVPDEQVVGELHRGWALARNTLSNERVVMGKGMIRTLGLLVDLLDNEEHPAGSWSRAGGLICDAQALDVLKHRATLRQVSGTDPGAAPSVVKLESALHEQRVAEFGLELLGTEGATMEGSAARWGFMMLSTRAMTLVGGTTEVQRNLVGERILGLPRDVAS